MEEKLKVYLRKSLYQLRKLMRSRRLSMKKRRPQMITRALSLVSWPELLLSAPLLSQALWQPQMEKPRTLHWRARKRRPMRRRSSLKNLRS
jgi:hypothetical protein